MTETAPPDLVRLIYKSRSALEGTGSDIQRGYDAILETSRRRNAAEGVTGALMFTHFLFVQALEGPAEVVEQVFDRICCDLRHTAVEIIEYGPAPARSFGDWSMTHLEADGRAQALLDQPESEVGLAEAAGSALKLMAALLRAGPVPAAEVQRVA